ncbi:major capsid protein [Scenedesmus sp. NREL 46B-D3]|nr:major capsid protein [Scenedesmus sp. NREL 46B-D3]
MPGAHFQLVASSTADTLLYGSPQVVFFKSVWRRPTPHAVEAVLQSWNGTADFGRKCSCTIARIGDLCHRLWLQVTLPALPPALRWTNAVGLALVKLAECELGGVVLDRHVAEWEDAWSELSHDQGKRKGFNRMVGRLEDWDPRDDAKCLGSQDATLYVPLSFWFSGSEPGNALPLVAITYHALRINLEFRRLDELVVSSDPAVSVERAMSASFVPPSVIDMQLYADMVYLASSERRRWAKMPHELLITSVQQVVEDIIIVDGNPQRNRRIQLPFSHPLKELVWVYVPNEPEQSTGARFFDYRHAFDGIAVLTNSQERQTQRPGSYFTCVQPFQHHTHVPDKPIYVYSFALQPEPMQPSGSLNATALSLELAFRVTMPERSQGKIMCFAVGYNVLRIANGLSGIAFSSAA